MNKIEKRSISKAGCFMPQPVFIIGTYNEDGTPNLSTVTGVSYAYGPPECLIISLYCSRRTKENLLRCGAFTANLCTVEMARLADYVGTVSGLTQCKDALPYDCTPGEKIHAPVLDASPYVKECRVLQTHRIGETHIIIAEIVNLQVGVNLGHPENDSDEAYLHWLNSSNLQDANPLLYAWKYYKIGDTVGKLGELSAELTTS